MCARENLQCSIENIAVGSVRLMSIDQDSHNRDEGLTEICCSATAEAFRRCEQWMRGSARRN